MSIGKETPEAKEIILSELSRHGNKARACRAADISRQALWAWQRKDAGFKAKVKYALKKGGE